MGVLLIVCFQKVPFGPKCPKEPYFSFDINMEDSFSVPPPLYKNILGDSDSGGVSWSHVKAGGSQWGARLSHI